jgi:predicted flap endonuclease-1-like 5' DNA nuclease
VQHAVEASPETVIVREPQWSPRRPETISEIEREIDRLKVGPFTRPKNIEKWLAEATVSDDGGAPGEGMELIPSNIRSKRICYETEGGFVIEVEYREAGDVRTKYYTISKKQGRRQALAAIKSGSYAKVTNVTDEMIAALKPSRRKAGRKRIQAGTVSTWPITNKVNVTDIEGIGDEYQARLKEIGYYTTDQLRLGNPNILAAHVSVREAVVRQWQSQAEIMLVKGVGKQMAELLTRAGINGIDDLKTETPKALADKVKAAREGRKVRITAAGVGPKRAQTIIREARALRRRAQEFPELGPVK